MSAHLSAAQANALQKVRADGVAYLGDGIRSSTFVALERLGLVTIDRKPGVRMFGTLGPAGGRYRGYVTTEWTIYPTRTDGVGQ